MNFFAPTSQSKFCDMAGLSTAYCNPSVHAHDMEEFIRIPISLKDQGSGSVQSGAIPTQKLKSFWWVIVRHFSCLFKLEEAVQDF